MSNRPSANHVAYHTGLGGYIGSHLRDPNTGRVGDAAFPRAGATLTLPTHLSVTDLVHIAHVCLRQVRERAHPEERTPSWYLVDSTLSTLEAIYVLDELDPPSAAADDVARALAPDAHHDLPATPNSPDTAGSGAGVTPTPDGGEGLPPIPSPPPALLQSSTGSDTVRPRAGGVGDPRHQAVIYYAITGSGAITTVRCPHKHRTDAGARDCANLLAETIDGMVGQVCHLCDTLLAAARDDARRIHRWEPISTTTDYDVDHGPMMCPVCAASSREELGRDEGQR